MCGKRSVGSGAWAARQTSGASAKWSGVDEPPISTPHNRPTTAQPRGSPRRLDWVPSVGTPPPRLRCRPLSPPVPQLPISKRVTHTYWHAEQRYGHAVCPGSPGWQPPAPAICTCTSTAATKRSRPVGGIIALRRRGEQLERAYPEPSCGVVLRLHWGSGSAVPGSTRDARGVPSAAPQRSELPSAGESTRGLSGTPCRDLLVPLPQRLAGSKRFSRSRKANAEERRTGAS